MLYRLIKYNDGQIINKLLRVQMTHYLLTQHH